MALPHYYSRLAPFEDLFLTGLPVLTYHHVGPRRRGARLKGLYVSPNLFDRQVEELRAARFQSADLPAAVSGSNESRHIVLTFDDGFRDVFEHALPILKHHGFRGIIFLVSSLIGGTNEWQQRAGDIPEPLMDEVQVRDWLAAGQHIGSHTLTHPWLTRLAPDAAREEIVSSRRALQDRFGVPVEHFCYPYGDCDKRVRDLVAEAGYHTACTTKTGINLAAQSPLELKRFTARYPSRNLKAILGRIKNVCGL
jgi:peptidoglycan/xylan/chitin deacetylase (PgdA/CDA1 family)